MYFFENIGGRTHGGRGQDARWQGAGRAVVGKKTDKYMTQYYFLIDFCKILVIYYYYCQLI